MCIIIDVDFGWNGWTNHSAEISISPWDPCKRRFTTSHCCFVYLSSPKVLRCNVSVLTGGRFSFNFNQFVMYERWLLVSRRILTDAVSELRSLIAAAFTVWRRTIPFVLLLTVVVVVLVSTGGTSFGFGISWSRNEALQIDWWWRWPQWRHVFFCLHSFRSWPNCKQLKHRLSLSKMFLRWAIGLAIFSNEMECPNPQSPWFGHL